MSGDTPDAILSPSMRSIGDIFKRTENFRPSRQTNLLNIALLITAALLEITGDALIRHGLKNSGIISMLAGVAVLAAYGFMVNLTKLDFGHLMGVYIVVFFVVSQFVAVLIFKERLHFSILVGGAFILLGGVVMSVWQK